MEFATRCAVIPKGIKPLIDVLLVFAPNPYTELGAKVFYFQFNFHNVNYTVMGEDSKQKLFTMLVLLPAPKRSFALPDAMHSRLAAHQPVFVNACFNLSHFHYL